jgi:hypothetical protein
VSKRAASRYRGGPSKAWIKTKNVAESEFVLLGLENGALPHCERTLQQVVQLECPARR